MKFHRWPFILSNVKPYLFHSKHNELTDVVKIPCFFFATSISRSFFRRDFFSLSRDHVFKTWHTLNYLVSPKNRFNEKKIFKDKKIWKMKIFGLEYSIWSEISRKQSLCLKKSSVVLNLAQLHKGEIIYKSDSFY